MNGRAAENYFDYEHYQGKQTKYPQYKNQIHFNHLLKIFVTIITEKFFCVDKNFFDNAAADKYNALYSSSVLYIRRFGHEEIFFTVYADDFSDNGLRRRSRFKRH